MTFGHWDFDAGSSIHEHFHPQEEVWEILEGELELTVDGAVQVAGPGMAAIVPANATHSVRALHAARPSWSTIRYAPIFERQHSDWRLRPRK